MNVSSREINFIAFITINATLHVTGIILNSLVVLCFWRMPRLRKDTFYAFILVLSCIDLVTVIVLHPLILFSCGAWLLRHTKSPVYRVNERALSLFAGLSLPTILIINTERYLAVVWPFFYRKFVTKQRLLILLFLFWLIRAIQWGITFKVPPEPFGFTIPWGVFVLLLYMTYKVCIVARHLNAKTLQQGRTHVRSYIREQIFTRKIVLTCVLIVICYFTFACPITVGCVIAFLQKKPDDLQIVTILWLETLFAANSTVNCLILFWKNGRLRKEGKRALRYFLKRTRVSPSHEKKPRC